ncbi:MAG: G1 family glutamic endopeptidase [Solirubrobacteraceae bacterium]
MSRFRLIAILVALGPLVGPGSALAHVSESTNWAGYAVHRQGESFHQVVGVWREPTLTCRPGHQTFSSYWVGLGGFSSHSHALEQTGTEVDCMPGGHVRSFAWFELVPAPSVRIGLRVPPGDMIEGAVTVSGRSVGVSIRDLTRHTSFSKVLRARVLDISAAEWIVEAPSDCFSDGQCMTLPLANFGSIGFQGALARSSAGHIGSISDARWQATKIRLIPDTTAFVAGHGGLGMGGQAAPSSLHSRGSAFSVSYSPFRARVARATRGRLVATGRLVHPGR